MQIQTCIKGIQGETYIGSGDGLTWVSAVAMITSGQGILSRWWQAKGLISPGEVQAVLTEANLVGHLDNYAAFGPTSPFISLAAGWVERDAKTSKNHRYSAVDTALRFATRHWKKPGALFYCWTPVSVDQAVEIASVSEPVRDTLIYRGWMRYQHQGEITAKVAVPANQISRVEWWDGSHDKKKPIDVFHNPNFVEPTSLINYREYF
jgi:hypothetical protein